MSELLIVDAAMLGRAHGWLRAVDGVIDEVGLGSPRTPGDAAVLDAEGADLLPGFIDLHLHGAAGHDVLDADPEGLRAIARFLVRHGVTAFAPTISTAPPEQTLAAVEAVAAARGPVVGGAEVLGAHLEGPWISAARCGAQDPAHIRPPDLAEFRRLAATGAVARITLAPELPGAHELITEAVAADIAVSIGHSDATFAQAQRAFRWGVASATHLFNAMRPFEHREPGVAGAVLLDDEVVAELIVDGIHVHSGAADLAWRVKGPHGIALISDSLRDTDGSLDPEQPAVRLPDGILAGSTLTLDRALRSLPVTPFEPVSATWEVTSRTPARVLGLQRRLGGIRPRMDASVVLLDAELRVVATVVRGETVYLDTSG